jgi:hypothetical protein
MESSYSLAPEEEVLGKGCGDLGEAQSAPKPAEGVARLGEIISASE